MPAPALKPLREVYRKVLGNQSSRFEAELLSRLPYEAPGILTYILVYHLGFSEAEAKDTVTRLKYMFNRYGLVPEGVETRRKPRKKEEAGGVLKPKRPVKRL